MISRFFRRRLRAGPRVLICVAGSLWCNEAVAQKPHDPPPQDKGESAMTTATPQTAHKFTNRLIHSTSPYLLQHAHNPVDWYPWGPEALERARKENKPIFLSIGYSACHWCHVMERECFENEEIAALMNKHFVCIKVDREERPDLDDIYMAATQALTRSGGWPMSVWLMPDQRPFYAGTYFPPDDRYGPQRNFTRILTSLAEAWRTQKDQLNLRADQVTDAVRRLTRVEPGNQIVPQEVIARTAAAFARAFDPVKGGLGGGNGNKFPPSMAMDLMLRAHHQSLGNGGKPDTRLLELVELTLQKMAFGGIYDHLGGGIARYSTDPDWLVPHFEKMLYDQALVSDIYLKAYQATGKALYAEVAGDILDYVIADLQSPEGGFYSTRDADSEGEEGRFYVWSRGEIEAALGPEDAPLFCDYYGVTASGNWEGHNILNIQRPMATVARLHKLPVDELRRRLEGCRKKLFELREQRVKPHLDDKVLAAWNGLMIASLARAYRILDAPRYRDSATRAAEFVLTSMRDEKGRLLRTYRKGKTHTPGYLDDHAFMIDALLTLYETTFDLKWLKHAEGLNEQLMAHYRDKTGGGFFFTADDAEQVLVRNKSANDGATPSGSSVQFMNLQRLAILLDRRALAAEAEKMLRVFGDQLGRSPFSSERMLSGVDFYHRRPKEIAFVGRASDAAGLDRLIRAAWRAYVPNAVFARLIEDAPDAKATAERIPLLARKTTIDGKATVYVCKDFACQAPTTDEKTMLAQIGP